MKRQPNISLQKEQKLMMQDWSERALILRQSSRNHEMEELQDKSLSLNAN